MRSQFESYKQELRRLYSVSRNLQAEIRHANVTDPDEAAAQRTTLVLVLSRMRDVADFSDKLEGYRRQYLEDLMEMEKDFGVAIECYQALADVVPCKEQDEERRTTTALMDRCVTAFYPSIEAMADHISLLCLPVGLGRGSRGSFASLAEFFQNSFIAAQRVRYANAGLAVLCCVLMKAAGLGGSGVRTPRKALSRL